jgi:spermidine synthase
VPWPSTGHPQVKVPRDRLLPLCAVALLSGAASIVYQINWQRELTFVFGVSHFATTTIILGFFLGFALGAWLASRLVDRGLSAALVVAGLEGTVAVYAWLATPAFTVVRRLAMQLAPPAQASLASVTVTRVLLATLAVIAPTVCMGATIPAFLKAALRRPESRGRVTGIIAGVNTAGALLGALVTTFVLMGTVRGSVQVHLASGLNALACLIAVAVHLRRPASPPGSPEAPSEAVMETATGRRSDRRLLAAYALSGAAGLGLELEWNRIVYMCLDHTVYTFALTLTTYLVGYSLGALASSRWVGRRPVSRNTVALLMLASLVTTVLGFRLYHAGLHVHGLQASLGYFPAAALVAAAILLLPTACMGAAMPLVFHLVTRDLATLGADAGHAQLVNNAGSVVAVLLVGFALVPSTSAYLVSLFCCALLAIGFLLLIQPKGSTRVRRLLAYGGAAFAAVVVLQSLPVGLHDGHVRQFYRHPVALREDASGLWGLDQPSAHLVVLRLNGYYENHVPLIPQRSIQGDFLIPAMFKPRLGSVYMVGLGLGIGAFELLRLSDVERFEAAELSPEAERLARWVWGQIGGSFFDDSRFRVVREDGRAYLESSSRSYDVVISGTNRIFYAGSTHLYSVEYWAMVKEHLAPGGVLLQWLPIYSRQSSASLLASFRTVFPDPLVVRYTSYVYLLGFKDGPPADLRSMVGASFARAPEILGTTELANPEMLLGRLMRVSRNFDREAAVINHDDLPVCEYSFRGFESDDAAVAGNLAERLWLEPWPVR